MPENICYEAHTHFVSPCNAVQIRLSLDWATDQASIGGGNIGRDEGVVVGAALHHPLVDINLHSDEPGLLLLHGLKVI